MMRHVTRVTAFVAGLLLATAAVWAQSSPSHFPAATQPLDGADAVLMDQGVGCASGIPPCATRQSPTTRIGQPFQNAAAPISPFLYQQWIDTSVSPPQLKMRIGSSWFTVATLDSITGFEFNVPSTAVTGLGTMATQDADAVAITGGAITGMPTPTATSDVATKQYVDGKASGIVFQQAVDYATAAILPNTPVYANGTLGVGRTLTAGSNTTLTVDGTVAVLTKRVLVKDQSDQTQNGCYSVTTAGGGAPWVLTGCTDWDTSAEMQTGSYFIVTAGATNAATSWVLNTSGTVVVGSTPLAFVQSGASNIYTAGTGLTLGGAVFSITNTGVTAATYGSATQVGQFAVNAQGQITTASSVAIAIAASQLTNGTTGTGAVALQTSPVFATQVSAPNYQIGTGLAINAGTVGFFNGNGPGLQFYGTASGGSGQIIFLNAAGAAMMSLTAAGVMTVPSISISSMLTAPTLTGSTSVNSNLYLLGGASFAAASGVYNLLYDRAGNFGLLIGSAGDPTNYYRNTAHNFGNIGGGVSYAQIGASGLNVTSAMTAGTTINVPTYQISGVAFADSDGTHRILYDQSAQANIYLGGAGDPQNYYRNTTHNFQSIAGGATFLSLNSTAALFSGKIGVSNSGTPSSNVQAAIGDAGSGLAGNAGALNLWVSNAQVLSLTTTSVISNVSMGIGTPPGSNALNALGNINATTYSVGSSGGSTCAGAPGASFRVTSGLVTTC